MLPEALRRGAVNRKRVQRLMRLVGTGPRLRLREPHPGHRVYPYLLRDVAIDPGRRFPRRRSAIVTLEDTGG